MEFKRVLLGKSFLFFLALLLVLNCFFFLYQHRYYNGYLMVYNEVYDQILTDLEDTPWEEAEEICRNGYDEYLNWVFADRDTFYSDPVNSDTMYVYSQVQSQYAYLMSYEKYLTGIDEDVKKLQAVSFFSDPNSVAYKNTVKTAYTLKYPTAGEYRSAYVLADLKGSGNNDFAMAFYSTTNEENSTFMNLKLMQKVGDEWISVSDIIVNAVGVEKLEYASDEQVLEFFRDIKKEMLCEEYIHQHKAMNSLNPSSVNTLRIVSMRHDEHNIEIISATLKAGSTVNSFTDNLYGGGIVAEVDVESGIVSTFGFDKKNNRYTHHPVTQTQFIGFNIPNWLDVITLVKKAHSRLDEKKIDG